MEEGGGEDGGPPALEQGLLEGSDNSPGVQAGGCPPGNRQLRQ